MDRSGLLGFPQSLRSGALAGLPSFSREIAVAAAGGAPHRWRGNHCIPANSPAMYHKGYVKAPGTVEGSAAGFKQGVSTRRAMCVRRVTITVCAVCGKASPHAGGSVRQDLFPAWGRAALLSENTRCSGSVATYRERESRSRSGAAWRGSEAARAIGLAARRAVFGDIDTQGAAADGTAVERLDGAMAVGRIGHGDEGETPGAPGVPVGDEADVADMAVGAEQVAHVVAGSGEGQVTDEDVQGVSR